MIDLNSLLQNIVACDALLKEKQAIVQLALAEQAKAAGNLTAAQHAFDSAIAQARGLVLPAAHAAAIALETAADDEEPATGIIPMGPLPPTSPALHPELPSSVDIDIDDPDTRREDNVYEA